MTLKSIALTILFFAAAGVSAASPAAAEDLPPVIRLASFGVGFGKPYGTGIIAIAEEKGFVADEFKGTPVKFEWTYFTGTGPAINEALAGGQLDFAAYGSTPAIIARASGVPTLIISGDGAANIYAVARTDLPINSIKDLKGYRVTFQKATILHWAFLKAIAAAGLSASDVTILDLKTADQLTALAAKQADVDFGTSSLFPLRKQGIVKIIYSSKGDPRATGPGQFLVTTDFAKKYPDATLRVVRAFIKAAYWLAQDQNHAEAIQIWARSGIPPEFIAEDVSGLPFRDQFNPLLDDFFTWQYRDGIDFERQQKLIRNNIDLSAWIDPKFQEAALASLGLQNFWPKRGENGLPIKQASAH